MCFGNLMLVLFSAIPADLTPSELIGRFNSTDRVVREEAARTLEERGPEALAVLRTTLGSTEGAEARDRLLGLIGRVEARLLDRPTLVALDFDDRPLGEVVAALSARSGFAIAVDDPALAARRLTLRTPAPLPFWEAVDRLGRLGHVRHDPSPRRDPNGDDPGAPTIRLIDGDPPAIVAFAGPLRVHLFATHRHRDISDEVFEVSVRPPSPKKSVTTVTAEIQAFAEPNRFINAVGLPRLEAVDAQGRAIAPQPAAVVEPPNPAEHSWLIPKRTSLLHWHIPLGLPDPAPKSPLKLRGVLPVVISLRKPEPLVIPLAAAAAKTFRQGSVTIQVEKVHFEPGIHNTTVNFTLKDDVNPTDRPRASTGPEFDQIGDFLANRVEFQDGDGRPLGFNILGNQQNTGTSGETRVMCFVGGSATPPARLLIYRLNRLVAEIPFEFAGVISP